jgi:hypothetical protein
LLFVLATVCDGVARLDCFKAALRAIGAATVQRRGIAGMIWENVGAYGVRLEAGNAGDREHAISRNHAPRIKSLSADADGSQDFGIQATRFERGHDRFRCHRLAFPWQGRLEDSRFSKTSRARNVNPNRQQSGSARNACARLRTPIDGD